MKKTKLNVIMKFTQQISLEHKKHIFIKTIS